MNDPRRCTFDLASLPACSGDTSGAGCVTARQRAALTSIYSPVRDRAGVIHPGQPFGGEGDPAGWPGWISGTTADPAAQARPTMALVFGTEIFRYFVYSDPAWEYSKYNVSTWRKDTRAAAEVLNATNPNLNRFKAGKGRMILYHGWSDPALSALDSIRYYEAVQARDRGVREYFRMFLMPGVFHCGGGPGPDRVDWIAPIVDWVENNRAPIASSRSRA